MRHGNNNNYYHSFMCFNKKLSYWVWRIHSLYSCIATLGIKNGWSYWRLENAAIKDPEIALRIAANARREAELTENDVMRQCWESIAGDFEKSYNDYKNG